MRNLRINQQARLSDLIPEELRTVVTSRDETIDAILRASLTVGGVARNTRRAKRSPCRRHEHPISELIRHEGFVHEE